MKTSREIIKAAYLYDPDLKGISVYNGEITFWDSSLAQPTDEQIASYETAGNTAETNAGIDKTRRSQYLSWEQQMEMIYKDQKNGTTTFKDHCDKVRSDNPKS